MQARAEAFAASTAELGSNRGAATFNDTLDILPLGGVLGDGVAEVLTERIINPSGGVLGDGVAEVLTERIIDPSGGVLGDGVGHEKVGQKGASFEVAFHVSAYIERATPTSSS